VSGLGRKERGKEKHKSRGKEIFGRWGPTLLGNSVRKVPEASLEYPGPAGRGEWRRWEEGGKVREEYGRAGRLFGVGADCGPPVGGRSKRFVADQGIGCRGKLELSVWGGGGVREKHKEDDRGKMQCRVFLEVLEKCEGGKEWILWKVRRG